MNEPFHLEPPQDAEAHAEIVAHQREYVRAMAAKLSAGEPLDDMQRLWAAGILHAWADSVPDKPPRTPGQAPEFDHVLAALLAAHGHKTQEELAEAFGVSIQSLRRAIRKWGPDAEAFMRLQGTDRNLKKV